MSNAKSKQSGRSEPSGLGSMSRYHPLVESARIRKAQRDCPVPILKPIDCIRKALDDWGPYHTWVSWSGGRCSTVVLHMALQVKPDIKVLFNDTGVEFPETYEFIKRITKEWNVNLTVLKPSTTFWKIVEEYGFPMLRGKYKADSKSKDGRPMCCTVLKEEPLRKARIKCTITGIRVSEARMRMFVVAQKGQYYKAKTLKRWQFHPIAFWTTEDLLRYIEENEIPVNKIYGMGHTRCGCWPCTGYITWQKSLAQSHPKLYRFLAKQKGEPTLWEYADNDGCRQGS